MRAAAIAIARPAITIATAVTPPPSAVLVRYRSVPGAPSATVLKLGRLARLRCALATPAIRESSTEMATGLAANDPAGRASLADQAVRKSLGLVPVQRLNARLNAAGSEKPSL